jgi:uncharacterized protein with von Willebrand factor type A (vWA) domain
LTETDSHFLENILLFSRLLYKAGLPISPEQTMDFTQALEMIDIRSRDQVYYAARGLLITRKEHLHLFDIIFNRFWRMHGGHGQSTGQKAPIAPRHQPQQKKMDLMTLTGSKAQDNDPEIDVFDRSESYSASEVLQQKRFSDMTAEELETIKQLIRDMQWQVSLRQTRRRVSDSKGKILHLRKAMRSAAKHGGIAWDLSWQSRKIKQRPIILIADISGSMEKYARLLLQFFYSVTHSLRNVECFVFGTRLTRLTVQLRLKNIDRAIEQASNEVVDWSGGTRIGESLRTFNREWSRRVVRRGAIVIIVSDGWERGEVAVLKREMRYLQHRCYRLIWLNPLLGNKSYEPLVEGMAAALPFTDDFMPVHNLQSLAALSDHLKMLGKYRSGNISKGKRRIN